MCLLLVASPGSTPSKKDLQTSACNNPHGFGYAIIAGGKLITGKGMSARKVINEFLELRKQYPNGYAMFHARYATHGVKNELNCHPFKVGSDEHTYLAHNGVLDIKINNGDKRSDTRVFAEDTLPKLGGVTALDDDNVVKMIEKWAGGNKIAILTLNPDAQFDCYIINEDLGHWDNQGIWWSNNTYKVSSWYTYLVPDEKEGIEGEIVDKDSDDCPQCGAFPFEDANPYYCEMCYTCYDCMGMYGDSCMCWTPANEKYSQKYGAWSDIYGSDF